MGGAERAASGEGRRDSGSERLLLATRLDGLYVKLGEHLALEELLDDMVVRTLAGLEARAVILAGASGAGKTTLLRRVTAGHPDLSTEAPDGATPGMVFVQVPASCTVADLGIQIARTLGLPLRDGLKASVAWGAAMRMLQERDVRFLWLDEVTNILDNLNAREARKIRTHVKMALVNRRHRVGLVLSGTTPIVEFLLADAQVLRRSDVMEIAPVRPGMFKVIAAAIEALAAKAGMGVAPGLRGEVVPRLVHAALDQFGSSLEITKATILRATRRRSVVGDGPQLLGLDDYAFNWARAYGVAADRNPFVVDAWDRLDCAAIIARSKDVGADPAPRARRGPTRGKVV